MSAYDDWRTAFLRDHCPPDPPAGEEERMPMTPAEFLAMLDRATPEELWAIADRLAPLVLSSRRGPSGNPRR